MPGCGRRARQELPCLARQVLGGARARRLRALHPHLHVMATDGGFTPDGAFHPLPMMSLAPLEHLFRHSVFKMLLRKGLLTPERIKLMKSWERSGFNVNAAVRIGAADASGRENLARYLIRYYGYYSSVRAGRRRQGRERMPLGPVPLCDDAPHAKAARASWARFIKKVFAADPPVCPDCGGAMRIIAFIEDQRVVRAILEHLSLWVEPRPTPALPAAPRAPLELEYLPWVE
ncbi:MAG: transposase [Candidatus Geothermincolia bacterium]